MKFLKTFISCIVLLIPLFLNGQIQVHLQRPPINQLKIEDLWWLELKNPTQTTYNVYLKAEIVESKKGPIFRGSSNNFTLPAGVKRVRAKDISNIRDIWYYPEYKNLILKTGGVPDGEYTACIQVIKVQDNQQLGKDCLQISVRSKGSLRLLYPKNGDIIKSKTPLFSWTPLPQSTATGESNYRLKIVEILKGQTKEEAMKSNLPLYEGKALKSSSLRYPLRGKSLQEGKEYAWQVFAISEGVELAVSEIWKFEIGSPPIGIPLPPAIIVVSPNGGETWVPGNRTVIKWKYQSIRADEILGNIQIQLLKGGSWKEDITLDAPPGRADSGSYNWDIPLFETHGNDYSVRLIANRSFEEYPFSTEMVDESDTIFTIKSAGKIAYVSCEEGDLANSDIYVMDENGTHRLTSSPWSDESPSWSPNWRKIAFCSNRERGNRDIYVMNADGTNQLRITTNSAEDSDPAYSPDGIKIAFFSNRDGTGDIYVMNSDGTDQRRLTSSPGFDLDPAWSPDGAKIAFSSNRDGNGEIYVMNTDGTDQRRLTSSPGFDLDPAWSPDGAKIAFSSNRDGDYNIYVMNSDGTNQLRLTDYPTEERSPTWSPDGTKICFYSKMTGYYDLYVMNANGSNMKNLTNSTIIFDYLPDWSPGGHLMLEHPILDFPGIR
jgi:Tol biopolymer transport system component